MKHGHGVVPFQTDAEAADFVQRAGELSRSAGAGDAGRQTLPGRRTAAADQRRESRHGGAELAGAAEKISPAACSDRNPRGQGGT